MTQLTLFPNLSQVLPDPTHTWAFTLWRKAADKAKELKDSDEWKDIQILHNPEDPEYFVKAVKQEQ